MSDTEFVRHMPCDQCGSSDANSLYSDGSTFCFRCHAYSHGDNDVIHTHQRVSNVRLQGSAGRLQSRGISEKTAELFKTYKDGKVLRHYYYDSSGTLVGAKVRTKDKQFRCVGEVKTLFGMQLFKHKTAKDQKLIITEGEMDAMSVWEANPNWPVVSIPNGAASAKKAIQNNYEWINHYDKIVLFFDNDEAGQKAAIEAASVLPVRVRLQRNLTHSGKRGREREREREREQEQDTEPRTRISKFIANWCFGQSRVFDTRQYIYFVRGLSSTDRLSHVNTFIGPSCWGMTVAFSVR